MAVSAPTRKAAINMDVAKASNKKKKKGDPTGKKVQKVRFRIGTAYVSIVKDYI